MDEKKISKCDKAKHHKLEWNQSKMVLWYVKILDSQSVASDESANAAKWKLPAISRHITQW